MSKNFALFIICFFMSALYGNVEEKRRIIFIVNPISHEIKDLDLPKIIENNLDVNQFDYKIIPTQYAQHATKLATEALGSAEIIAAVGGDGTVNEVGKALIFTNATLAIIPVGSGNGLARHLGIPVGLIEGIKALNHADPLLIDTAKINDKVFLGVAGVGFDAHIAHQFAQFGKRGLRSYCQVAMREFSRYKPRYYSLTIDGKRITKKAFLLTVANSSQYGNDFIIAPKARISDGYLDLVVLDDIPTYSIPSLLYKFKHGTIDRSRHFATYRFKEMTIHHSYLPSHADGEPLLFQDNIKVTVQPKSLKILVPRKNGKN